jgi:hypothetical protein
MTLQDMPRTTRSDWRGASHDGTDASDRSGSLTRNAAAATALQFDAIHAAIEIAKRHPEIYVGEGQSLNRAEFVRFAERLAVFDLSLRLTVSENLIWDQHHLVATLTGRLPRIWRAFRNGDVSVVNARTAASFVRTIPEETGLDAAFEDAIGDAAMTLVAAKFRAKARIVRERLHPESIHTRHQLAHADRRVEIEPALDGMAWLHLFTDATAITKAHAHLDARAARQRADGAEQRTLAQVRADAAAELLTGDGTPNAVRAQIAITIPLTGLIDKPDLLQAARTDPAVLDGYGPIDTVTALLLAKDAPSFRRIFTDPIDGVELSMGRSRYRPTTAQRQWLHRKFGTCTVATCNRPSHTSDIDHLTDWNHDGPTDDDNLAPASHGHHRLKHMTNTTVTRMPDGTIQWTTATGFSRPNAPPPYAASTHHPHAAFRPPSMFDPRPPDTRPTTTAPVDLAPATVPPAGPEQDDQPPF